MGLAPKEEQWLTVCTPGNSENAANNDRDVAAF
jgi:hypothetical protein